MNREQKKRITQNLTNLKERLVDLDPIIDKLIERDVFTLSHRSRIEQVNPCTPQRKFNEFIQILLASPEPTTYQVFLEALTEERHQYMVDRLQSTVISGTSPIRNTTYYRDRRARVSSAAPLQRNYDGSGASGVAHGHSGGTNIDAMTSAMGKMLTDFGEKLTEELAGAFEKRRLAEKLEMEKVMEEKLSNFKKEWDEDKQNLLKVNDSAISNLKTSVEKLRRSNEEFEKLNEKYENLKQKQKEMREKETERWQRLSQANMENIQLKTSNDGLRNEIKDLKEKVKSLEEENRSLLDREHQSQVDLEHLAVENKILMTELDEKERERAELKREVELAYGRIHEVVKFQKEKSDLEDVTYKAAIEKQSEKLNEIFDVVNSLTARERTRAAPRNLYIGGNAVTTRAQKNQRGQSGN